MGQNKLPKTVFGMALREAKQYEKNELLQQEVSDDLLSRGIDAIFAIANSIDHLATATEKQAQQTVIVLNVNASDDNTNISHIKKMIEEMQQK